MLGDARRRAARHHAELDHTLGIARRRTSPTSAHDGVRNADDASEVPHAQRVCMMRPSSHGGFDARR
jgi:hypothetical protein